MAHRGSALIIVASTQLQCAIDELHGAKIFTILNLQAVYHQISVVKGIAKTAFQMHHDHYEFDVMSFGLTNALANFQAMMNMLFADHLRKFIVIFFDDILIYSGSITVHIQHLIIVFTLLHQHS